MAGKWRASRRAGQLNRRVRGGRATGVLDFGPRKSYFTDIYSLPDQPSGLWQGFVFLNKALALPWAGGVHAA